MLLSPVLVRCLHCLAAPGQDCKTPNGATAPTSHKERKETFHRRIRNRDTFTIKTTDGDPVRGILPNHEYTAMGHPVSRSHILILGPTRKYDSFVKLHDADDCVFIQWDNQYKF